ncbi:MAG: hypothetical protein U1E14_10615 [Geminicoccaceae bacterium]
MTIRPMLAAVAFAALLAAGTAQASGSSTRPAEKPARLQVVTTCTDEAVPPRPLQPVELAPTHRSGQAAAR